MSVRLERRAAYEQALADARTVVNRLDPIGLIAGGAPDTEYDLEVTDLVRLVMRPERFGEDEIEAIWRSWFGEVYTKSRRRKSLRQQTQELRRLQEQFASPS